LKLAEDYKTLPLEILVKREEAFQLLEPITSELGIYLRRVKRLQMLEQAQKSMLKFLFCHLFDTTIRTIYNLTREVHKI